MGGLRRMIKRESFEAIAEERHVHNGSVKGSNHPDIRGVVVCNEAGGICVLPVLRPEDPGPVSAIVTDNDGAITDLERRAAVGAECHQQQSAREFAGRRAGFICCTEYGFTRCRRSNFDAVLVVGGLVQCVACE